MSAQRDRARSSGHFGVAAHEDAYRRLGLDDVTFLGYDTVEAEGTVVMVLADGHPVVQASEGMVVEVVLDRTPFYAESGGRSATRAFWRAREVLNSASPTPGAPCLG